MVISAQARLFTAASMGDLEVVKQSVESNAPMIRVADDDGLHPGFTGPTGHILTNIGSIIEYQRAS